MNFKRAALSTSILLTRGRVGVGPLRFSIAQYATHRRNFKGRSNKDVEKVNVHKSGERAGEESAERMKLYLAFGFAGVFLVVLPSLWALRRRYTRPEVFEDVVPITGRNRKMVVPLGWETSAENVTKMDAHYQGLLENGVLGAGHSITMVCRAVLERLLEATPELQRYQWELNVSGAFDPNALVTPNGKMLINMGLLMLFENEDEIAAILSHEIAHVLARHIPEQIMNQMKHQGRNHFDFIQLTHLPANVAMESEADHIGLMLMSRACFDPTKAPGVWHKIEEYDQQLKSLPGLKQLDSMESTHPTNIKRFEDLSNLLPRAIREGQHSECLLHPNESIAGPSVWSELADVKQQVYEAIDSAKNNPSQEEKGGKGLLKKMMDYLEQGTSRM